MSLEVKRVKSVEACWAMGCDERVRLAILTKGATISCLCRKHFDELKSLEAPKSRFTLSQSHSSYWHVWDGATRVLIDGPNGSSYDTFSKQVAEKLVELLEDWFGLEA